MSDRRSFLRDWVRMLVLGGMAVTGVVLGSRSRSEGLSSACPADQACRGCSRLTGCREPRADRFREEKLPDQPRDSVSMEGKPR
jgi:hypothetical protein